MIDESFHRAIENPQELACFPCSLCAFQARRQVRIVNDESGSPVHAMPVDRFL
jgi:hypothetical protein